MTSLEKATHDMLIEAARAGYEKGAENRDTYHIAAGYMRGCIDAALAHLQSNNIDAARVALEKAASYDNGHRRAIEKRSAKFFNA